MHRGPHHAAELRASGAHVERQGERGSERDIEGNDQSDDGQALQWQRTVPSRRCTGAFCREAVATTSESSTSVLSYEAAHAHLGAVVDGGRASASTAHGEEYCATHQSSTLCNLLN